MAWLLILSLLTSLSPIDTICNRAAYLLFNRHLNPHYLDSAYHLLAHARQLDPRHEQTLYLWSRIHTQLGELEPNRERKIRLFERARAIAETLQQVNPDNPDGHMWWAVAQGRIGEVRGVLNSLFMVPALKKAFHRVLELDPKYPTVYDALGVLYYELPPFAGQDLKQAEKYLIKGLQLDPNYTVLRLDLARVYLKQGRRDAACEQLRLLLKTAKPTYPADFYLDDKPEAERLLRQLGAGN